MDTIEVYTDETKIGFGRYKNYKMAEIPDDYLQIIYKQAELKTHPVREYIKARLNIVEYVPKNEPFPCTKYVYATKALANEGLRHIRSSPGQHQKPVRSYECPICGGWHHTSQYDQKQLKFNNG